MIASTIIIKPLLVPSFPGLLLLPREDNHHPKVKCKLEAPGKAYFRKELHAEGVSEKSAFLIINAKKSGTNSHCKSAWRMGGGKFQIS